MSSLSSYLELFAAINFAFVISTHFIRSISDKVCVQYLTIKGLLQQIIGIHDNASRSLLNEENIAESNTVIDGLIQTSKLQKAKIDKYQVIINNLNSDHSEIFNFNYLCLFGVFYCTFNLISIGFLNEEDMNAAYMYGFSFMNIASSLVLLWLFDTKKKFMIALESGYFQVVLIFFSIVVFSIGVWIVQARFEPFITIVSKQLDALKFINKIFLVLIPLFHFLYYFVVTIRTTKRTAQALQKELLELKKECEKFNYDMSLSIDVVNQLKVVAPEPENDKG